MIYLFITPRFLDFIDVLLVAFLLYQLYMLLKGTAAFNIVMGIVLIYLISWVIQALNMELMGKIMGQIVGVGVIALIVVFQQEIRRVLLMLGTKYNLNKALSLDKMFTKEETISEFKVKEVVMSCENMARSNTGALIVFTNETELKEYIDTGEVINADISGALLETIFFKNSPLHDGAVIISGSTIVAARCVLPVTEDKLKNKKLGLRHRAAIGMSQETDAQIVIVSEETGELSYAFEGKLTEGVNHIELTKLIEEIYKR